MSIVQRSARELKSRGITVGPPRHSTGPAIIRNSDIFKAASTIPSTVAIADRSDRHSRGHPCNQKGTQEDVCWPRRLGAGRVDGSAAATFMSRRREGFDRLNAGREILKGVGHGGVSTSVGVIFECGYRGPITCSLTSRSHRI